MRSLWGIGLGTAVGLVAAFAWADAPAKPSSSAAPARTANPDGVKFFENRIRPLLAENCYTCHGPKVQKSELRLDQEASVRKGGESGPLLDLKAPEKSLLLKAVHYDGPIQMPPQGRLRPGQIEDLTTWVRMGAPWGRPNSPDAAKAETPERPFWAFQPVRRPAVPKVKLQSWVRNPIDAFVLSRLEAKGLHPAPPASKRELIRRAYFDLIGLPPSPEDVDRFLADTAPEVYERLIDRLLASPQYGERWGRHWLDVVRYAQTNGYERDDEKPNAWRYRDYVIKSFNQDKPYDQFIREQLAGDELTPATDDGLTATAFYRLGVWDDEPDDARQAEFDNLDDMLSTAGQAFLGVSIGCARCHDHKFDPIPQADYYGMLAFFRNIKRYEKPPEPGKPATGEPSIFAKLSTGDETLAVKEIGAAPIRTNILIRGQASTPGAEVAPHFIRAMCPSPAAADPVIPAVAPGAKSTGRRHILADWIASSSNPLTARVMANRVWQHHFGTGIVPTPNDFGHAGTAPTDPQLLDFLASAFVSTDAPAGKYGSSGVAGYGSNAHTATPSHTRTSSTEATSYPGLRWSLKKLHRLIMLSSTYRQSSRATDGKGEKADPANQLLWHQNMHRLEAEAIRDSILSVSGKLNLEMGGRGIFPVLPPEVLATQSRPGNGWGNSPEPQRSRRSVYIYLKRTLGVPILETFDGGTPDSSVAARATTTIAPQALILLNSAFMNEQSDAFADRLLKEGGPDPARNIERAFRLALSRPPTAREGDIARKYLERRKQEFSTMPADQAYRRALSALCKVVLNLNEFVYVD